MVWKTKNIQRAETPLMINVRNEWPDWFMLTEAGQKHYPVYFRTSTVQFGWGTDFCCWMIERSLIQCGIFCCCSPSVSSFGMLHIEILFLLTTNAKSGHLNDCSLFISARTNLAILLWSFSSTGRFRQQSCTSLDVFLLFIFHTAVGFLCTALPWLADRIIAWIYRGKCSH